MKSKFVHGLPWYFFFFNIEKKTLKKSGLRKSLKDLDISLTTLYHSCNVKFYFFICIIAFIVVFVHKFCIYGWYRLSCYIPIHITQLSLLELTLLICEWYDIWMLLWVWKLHCGKINTSHNFRELLVQGLYLNFVFIKKNHFTYHKRFGR